MVGTAAAKEDNKDTDEKGEPIDDEKLYRGVKVFNQLQAEDERETKPPSEAIQKKPPSDESSHNRKSIEALMKAYTHRTKYTGSFTESFDAAIEHQETPCSVCECSESDMGKAFPVMLSGAAFTHYSHNYSKKNLSYRELVESFRSIFASIKRIKSNKPKTLFTIQDLWDIKHAFNALNDISSDSESSSDEDDD